MQQVCVGERILMAFEGFSKFFYLLARNRNGFGMHFKPGKAGDQKYQAEIP